MLLREIVAVSADARLEVDDDKLAVAVFEAVDPASQPTAVVFEETSTADSPRWRRGFSAGE